MKPPSDNSCFASRLASRAFTIIELIVVIGIIVVIASLVLGMLGKANKTAQRTRQSADLQSISQALEAYRADMHDYPRLPPGTQATDPNFVSGAELLCWALLAPGPAVTDTNHPVADGSDGMGFRTRGTKGQTYGPYLTPEKFRLFNMNNTATTAPPNPPPLDDDSAMVILDYWDHPIYYCPATPNVDPTQGAGYVNTYSGAGPHPMYDTIYFKEPKTFTTTQFQEKNASLGAQDLVALATVQEMVGDTNHDGTIDGSELQQNLPFLLWSAGPNGIFGYDKTSQGVLVSPHASDDVTNFTIYFPP